MSQPVLIIENDPAVGTSLESAFEAQGHLSHVVSSGEEALELAAPLNPAAVVLSVELPGMSGYSLCRKLRELNGLGEIPLVLTSATATREDFDEHRERPGCADAYFHKPFDAEEVVEWVLDTLDAGTLISGDSVDEYHDLSELIIEEEDEVREAYGDPDVSGDEEEELVALDDLGADDLIEVEEVEEEEEKVDEAHTHTSSRDELDQTGEHPVVPEAMSGGRAWYEQTDDEAADARGSDDSSATASVDTGPESEELDAMRAERDAATAKVASLEERVKALEAQTRREGGASSARELLTLRETLNRKEREVLELKDEIFKRDHRVLEAEEERDALESRHKAAETARAEAQARIDSAEASASTAREQTADKERELASAREELQAARQQAGSLRQDLDAARGEASAKSDEVRSLTEERDKLAQRRDELQREVQEGEQQRAELESSLEKTTEEARQLKDQLASAMSERDELSSALKAEKEGHESSRRDAEQHLASVRGEAEEELVRVRREAEEELNRVRGEAKERAAEERRELEEQVAKARNEAERVGLELSQTVQQLDARLELASALINSLESERDNWRSACHSAREAATENGRQLRVMKDALAGALEGVEETTATFDDPATESAELVEKWRDEADAPQSA